MADLRKAFISGRFTAQPEVKIISTDLQVCNFSLANKRKTTKNNSEAATDFFECSIYGQGADFIVKYFNKGDTVFVEAEIQNQTYMRDDVKITKTVFKVVDVFFGPKKLSEYKAANSTPTPTDADAPAVYTSPPTQPAPSNESEDFYDIDDAEFEEFIN